MSNIATAISVTAAAAAAASHAGGRRRLRGSVSVSCSSAADERQALFSRIAPVYDHVRASRSPPSFRSREISADTDDGAVPRSL